MEGLRNSRRDRQRYRGSLRLLQYGAARSRLCRMPSRASSASLAHARPRFVPAACSCRRKAVDSILGRKGGDNAATARGQPRVLGKVLVSPPIRPAAMKPLPRQRHAKTAADLPRGPLCSCGIWCKSPRGIGSKARRSPAAKGRDEGRDRTRQESRSPERGQTGAARNPGHRVASRTTAATVGATATGPRCLILMKARRGP